MVKTAGEVAEEIRREDKFRAEKAAIFAEQFMWNFMNTRLGQQAKAEKWDEKLKRFVFACADYYSCSLQGVESAPSDIYRSLPNIRGLDRVEWKLRDTLREQAHKGLEMALFVPEGVINGWKERV